MIIIIALILGWIVCGIISYGALLSYYQKESPVVAKRDLEADKYFSLKTALYGPFTLIACVMSGIFKHGLMYKTRRQ